MTDYALPPCTHTADGTERRVGFELEFGGLPPDEVAKAICEVIGGDIEGTHPFVTRVLGTSLGDIRVEVDALPLKEKVYADFLEDVGIDLDASALASWIEEGLGALAQTVVPTELVTAPIALSQLHRTEVLWRRLAEAGAQGTKVSVAYAFGLHLNPELPRLDAETMLAHLRAFLLLYDWLVREENVDVSRRLTPFIFPFPEGYRRRVLDPAYAPDIDALVADYVEDNPTRNRPLDLLPAFASLRPGSLEGFEGWELIQPRPALHYRLPDSRLGEPGWSPARAWNRWVEVEKLATDRERMLAMTRAYLHTPELPFRLHCRQWASQTETFLDGPSPTPASS